MNCILHICFWLAGFCFLIMSVSSMNQVAEFWVPSFLDFNQTLSSSTYSISYKSWVLYGLRLPHCIASGDYEFVNPHFTENCDAKFNLSHYISQVESFLANMLRIPRKPFKFKEEKNLPYK